MTDRQDRKSVTIRGITKHFGSTVAVDDVSIAIPGGSFCTLLGPSGSGKTTLLRMIAGYEQPSAGRIEIDGRDIARVAVADRNIGMVFQNYALFPHMTVAKNLAFPLEMRKLPAVEIDARVTRMLEMVGLAGYGARLPRQLSGGQQQRVALGRALIFSPDILLMDEPLGALDKNLRQSMQNEIKRIHTEVGVTVVYVTHDQEEAINLSDQVVVMNEGRVVQSGTPSDLYDRPATTFVATFLGECNLIDAEWDAARHAIVLGIGNGIPVKTPAAPPGGKFKVGIRPERLKISTEPPSSGITMSGTVESVSFIGPDHRLTVSVGQKQLLVRSVNTGGTPAVPSALVYLSCTADDLAVLTA